MVGQVLEIPLLIYSRTRSLSFVSEFVLFNRLSRLAGLKKPFDEVEAKLSPLLQEEMDSLLRRDIQNISRGIYPFSVLRPESPVQHFMRVPKLLLEGLRLYQRRRHGKTTVFDKKARELLPDLPRYYRRNFHFQPSGYLSEKSAELYEHQVEMLFGGTADAMRRLIIPPMKSALPKTEGRDLTLLEIGAGTGRATRFVKLAFPKAKIVALDLSDPYLKLAQKKLSEFPNIDFVHGSGEALPYQTAQFDGVYSVFLFHELPRETRVKILSEAKRVLKPGGFFGMVDSVQLGDFEKFDPLLQEFPKEYHEPFYRNYIENPMAELFQEAGLPAPRTERGFLSKVCWVKSSG